MNTIQCLYPTHGVIIKGFFFLAFCKSQKLFS